MYPDRTYRRGAVQVTKHFVDWPNMAPDFSDHARSTYDRFVRIPSGTTDHFYLNPAYTVTASGTVPEVTFIAEARRACILWMQQIGRVLGTAARNRLRKKLSPAERNLIASGCLLLGGQPAHIKRLDERAAALK